MRPCEAKAQLILPLEGAAVVQWVLVDAPQIYAAHALVVRRLPVVGATEALTPPNPFPVEVVDVHRVDVVLRLVVVPFMFPILMLQFLMTGHNRAGKRGNVRKRQLSNLIVQSAQRSTTLVSVLNSVVLSRRYLIVVLPQMVSVSSVFKLRGRIILFRTQVQMSLL